MPPGPRKSIHILLASLDEEDGELGVLSESNGDGDTSGTAYEDLVRANPTSGKYLSYLRR